MNIIHLPTLVEYTTPTTNLNVDYELWKTLMYQCKFKCNKWTTLMSHAGDGGGYAYAGTGDIGEIYVLSILL